METDQAIHVGDTQSIITTPQTILPVKRKRGRPRKDQTPNQNRVEGPMGPPSTKPLKKIQPRSDTVNNNDTSGPIGQQVTGVVESAFEAGYLISVKIGNSDMNFRGVVFKPGHCLPITVENDIAPEAQMIQRNETHKLRQQQPSTNQNGPVKTTLKAKPLSVPQMGNITPVSLQTSKATSPELGDDEIIHTVEPLAMLPPAHRVTVQGQNGNSSSSSMTQPQVVVEEVKTVKSETHTLDESANEKDKDKNENKTETETNLFQEQALTEQKSYPTGRMTELLLALQENSTENQNQNQNQNQVVRGEEDHGLSSSETDTDTDMDEEMGD